MVYMEVMVSGSFQNVDVQNPKIRRFLLQTDPDLRGQIFNRFFNEVKIQLLHQHLLERAEPFGQHAFYIYTVPIDRRPPLVMWPVAGLMTYIRRFIFKESAYPATAAAIKLVAVRVAHDQELL